jgi:23S rRNA pseudouridine1911/1915/1917 synthase
VAKNLHAELLAILRKFELAGELTKYKEIKNVKEFSPRQLSQLIKFTFSMNTYYVLYDSSASDDVAVVMNHIQLDVPDVEGRLVRNPLETENKAYGMPHMGKDVYLFEKKIVKTRLDQELVQRYPEISRSTLQKYIKLGVVTINGEPAKSAKQDVTENDTIALVPPEKTDTSEKELPIIYIDDQVIVVNKPAGVLTHSKGALNDEFTVADFFRRYTTNALNSSRPGIVHRLDRDTSGVIIGARTDEAALLLKKQFAERTTKKHYTAVVDGMPKLDEAMIDLPIARAPSAPSTFRVDPKGKAAQTAYKVLGTNGTQSLVELKPKTGRTHQLRVHMQYIKTPIAGDRVYGNAKSAPRMCLHAHSLELTIPGSERKVFTAAVPPEFKEMIQ